MRVAYKYILQTNTALVYSVRFQRVYAFFFLYNNELCQICVARDRRGPPSVVSDRGIRFCEGWTREVRWLNSS